MTIATDPKQLAADLEAWRKRDLEFAVRFVTLPDRITALPHGPRPPRGGVPVSANDNIYLCGGVDGDVKLSSK